MFVNTGLGWSHSDCFSCLLKMFVFYSVFKGKIMSCGGLAVMRTLKRKNSNSIGKKEETGDKSYLPV